MAYGRILDIPRDLHPAARQAEQMVDHRARIAAQERSAPEPLHFIGNPGEPAFINSWRHYDAASGTPNFSGPTYRNAAFYKDRGRVYLQGVIGNGTLNQPAFILPEGYRPLNQQAFAVLANGALVYVLIEPTGGLIMTTLSNAYVFLSGISFRV